MTRCLRQTEKYRYGLLHRFLLCFFKNRKQGREIKIDLIKRLQQKKNQNKPPLVFKCTSASPLVLTDNATSGGNKDETEPDKDVFVGFSQLPSCFIETEKITLTLHDSEMNKSLT